jgi:type IV pilus assembly protein PilN
VKVLHPNLATRPYRDYRPVWAVAAILFLAMAALLAYNVHTAWRYFATTQETRVEIETLEREIAKERERAAAARQALDRFDTASLQARSTFVNARIAERAFSWSGLLDDMESVLPNDVRLTSLAPDARGDGSYVISLTCISKSEDGMVDLIQNFFRHPEFGRPTPMSESVGREGQGFAMRVEYRPAAAGVRE